MVTDEVLLRFVEFQSNLHILSFEGLDLVIIDVTKPLNKIWQWRTLVIVVYNLLFRTFKKDDVIH